MLTELDLVVLTAYLVERRSHRWIEENILGIASNPNWAGIEAKKYLWKFGLKEKFKNFLANVKSQQALEDKIIAYATYIDDLGVSREILKEVWSHSQNVFLFQRVIHNKNGWMRPVEGRLGFDEDGMYLSQNGFGHEDWNFNTDLTIENFLYGYMYQPPALHKQGKNFNIVFATFENQTWKIVGFYLNALFSIDGSPYDGKIINKKVQDLDFLKQNGSLGRGWHLSNADIEDKLKDELVNLRWKVHFKDVVVLPNPVNISGEVELPKNNRITTATILSQTAFFKILQISKSTVPSRRGQMMPDEEKILQIKGEDESCDEEELAFPEGRVSFRNHQVRERSRNVVKSAKEKFLTEHGKLFCECCGFSFSEKYGKVGENFIEAHHLIPVSELSHDGETKISDIVMLCSNCHRMVHRKRPWLNIENLRNLLKKN